MPSEVSNALKSKTEGQATDRPDWLAFGRAFADYYSQPVSGRENLCDEIHKVGSKRLSPARSTQKIFQRWRNQCDLSPGNSTVSA
jgi:hypothetical protein